MCGVILFFLLKSENMIVAKTKVKLESLDHLRDWLLFPFIKRCWPRYIVPNYLTSLRIILGVIIGLLLLVSGLKEKALIILLFCLGLFCDLFDGSVARALNIKTRIGAIMDPIADRFLILPVAIYSLYILSQAFAFYYNRHRNLKYIKCPLSKDKRSQHRNKYFC